MRQQTKKNLEEDLIKHISTGYDINYMRVINVTLTKACITSNLRMAELRVNRWHC